MPRLVIQDGCTELLIPRENQAPTRVMVATPGPLRGSCKEVANLVLPATDNWILSVVDVGKDPAESHERIECDSAEQLMGRAERLGKRRKENWLIALGANQLLEAVSKSTNPAWYNCERPCWISGDGPTCALLLTGGKSLWVCDVANYVDDATGKTSQSSAASSRVSEAAPGGASPTLSEWHGAHDRMRASVHAILWAAHAIAPDCWAATAGGIGWSMWRRHYLTQEVYHVEDKQTCDLERRCLYGGRVECFRLGDYPGRITRLDRVSHYPAVARDATLPHSFPQPWEGNPREAAGDIAHGRQILASVDIVCDRHTWPARDSGRVAWVCGRHTTWLAGAELGEAIRLGCVARINCAVCYVGGQPLASISGKLIDERLAWKQKGELVGASLLKRMSTGLYGRLIRRKTIWAEISGVCPRVLDGEWNSFSLRTRARTHYRACRGIVEQDVGSEAHEQSCVALGACLFASARSKMRELISIAGPAECFYLGVDGIHVTDLGRQRIANRGLIADDVPGMLRVESEGQPATYRGLYAYSIGDQTTGLPRLKPRKNAGKTYLSPGGIGEPTVDEARYRGIDDTLLADAGPETRKKYAGLVRPDGRVVPRCLG